VLAVISLETARSGLCFSQIWPWPWPDLACSRSRDSEAAAAQARVSSHDSFDLLNRPSHACLGRLYALAGKNSAGDYISVTEYLDLTTNTWTAAPSLSAPRAHLGAASAEGRVSCQSAHEPDA
jgi:hypothetical protein